MSLDVDLQTHRKLEERTKKDPLFKNLEYWSLSSNLVHNKFRSYYAEELKKNGQEPKAEVVNFYLGAAVREIRRLIFLRYPYIMDKDYISESVIIDIQKEFMGVGIDNNLMRNFIKFQLCDVELNMMKKNKDNEKDFIFRMDKGQENEHPTKGRPTHDIRARMKYNNLQKVTFKDLEINEVNFGKEIKLKFTHHGYSVRAKHVLCEDTEGIQREVYMYNLTEGDEKLIRSDIVLNIKHPYYKISIDGTPVIRVDRKERLQFVLDGIKDPNFFSEQGKKYYRSKEYLTALHFYGEALKLKKDSKFLNNIVLCNLRISNFKGALESAQECIKLCGKDDAKAHLKACYFEALALIKLTKYTEAGELINEYKKNVKGFKGYVKTLLGTMEKSKRELEGHFDLKKMAENFQSNYDITDYIGPIEIHNGKGGYATRDIKHGELICACKAFSSVFLYNFVDDHANVYYHLSEMAIRKSTDAFSQLRSKIFRKMRLQKELKDKIMQLGKTFPEKMEEKEEKVGKMSENDVDEERIAEIVNTNSYELKYSFSRLIGLHSAQGLFIIPALLNHKCTFNVNWYTFGDVVFLVAVRDIKKGEELNISYFSFEKGKKEKVEYFKVKGLKCSCKMCDGTYDIDDKEFLTCVENVKKRIVPIAKNFGSDWNLFLRLKRKYDNNPNMIHIYRYFLPCTQFDFEKGRVIVEGLIHLFKKFPFISFNSFAMPILMQHKYSGMEKHIWNVFERNYGSHSKSIFRQLLSLPTYVENKQYNYVKKECETKIKLETCSFKLCNKVEKRKNEFKLCTRCKRVKYCSRGCQIKDWKYRHKKLCVAK